MTSAELLRTVRRRHGLTQKQLAARARTSQAAISRIERGLVSPSVDMLANLVDLMGEELQLTAEPIDYGHDEAMLRQNLEQLPEQRIERQASWSRGMKEFQAGPSGAEEAFDPAPVVEQFARAGVDFVLIGRVAGGAHGSSYGTFDVDFAYARDRENLERIAEVLGSLGAVLRAPADVPFKLDARSLAAGANFTFSTSLGSIDILSDLAGAPPYHRLKADAMTIEVRGQPVRVASLDQLIAMKEAAGRPKDKLMATEYRKLSDIVRGAESGT